ncbi:MAG: dehydrogenase, partial [Roseibacillus sp.]|nr:dehydrogenase [Roseibacillus sp.]
GIVPAGKNLGFEEGTLRGWKLEGEVWEGGPVKGDTVTPRRPGQASQHDGEFWVGGYERSHSDEDQGVLISEPFKVTHPWGSFLIGGGPHPETRVEIVEAAGGEVVLEARGKQVENMHVVVVDLRTHLGSEIRVRVVDEKSGAWGHINYDDFRFHEKRPGGRRSAAAPMRHNNPILSHLVPNPGTHENQTVAGMMVPEGFVVDLIAEEPDLTQPIAFTFDERGRLWVVEAHSYPQRQPEGKGKDRIVILEDANQDGIFESRTVFAGGLNLVSGIEVGFGGVWVGAAPHLLFIPDRDRNDVPDGDPVVLLDGWGYQDTHETLNSFTWGPDGWLYGNQGVFCHSMIGKPGTPAEKRSGMRAGVWRYHPTRHKFE